MEDDLRFIKLVTDVGTIGILLFALAFAVCYLLLGMPKMIWQYYIKREKYDAKRIETGTA